MSVLFRWMAIIVVFACTAVAWAVLGGTTIARTDSVNQNLSSQVAELWGQPMLQAAPAIEMGWTEAVEKEETVISEGKSIVKQSVVNEHHTRVESMDASQIDIDLSLDERKKGLVWFPLYDVTFSGQWTWVHTGAETGEAKFVLRLPISDGVYDGFELTVNGLPQSDAFAGGMVSVNTPVEPGQKITYAVKYRSRGLSQFTYHPMPYRVDTATQYDEWGNLRNIASAMGEVGEITNFKLNMNTDFQTIDFPEATLSPSHREQTATGWKLDWTFDRLITGRGMGMVMPERVQPGELASMMSFSAPISLGLFIVWITALALVRRIEIHPVNYAFVAAAFFSFHLMFSYSADRLPIEVAFALSALISLILVVSYLRLVVGSKFAWREAGLAQVIYLIGFSLAHFWEGSTGLTVTILGVITLFALMQLTGRIRWSDVFAGEQAKA